MSWVGRHLAAREALPAPGAYQLYAPDLILLPEYALAIVADELQRGDAPRFPADRVLVVADHFSPPASIERAVMLDRARRAAAARGWELRLFEGICHQLLIEDPRVGPGSLVIGSDSHTVTAGALGALAFGFGSTDVLAALRAGRVALRCPEAIRVRLRGALPHRVMGKDVALALLARLGPERARYRVLEILDESEGGLSQDGRFAICNLSVEAGAKGAVFLPDAVTRRWLAARDGQPLSAPAARAADDEGVVDELEIDLGALEPLVARPHSPFDVIPVREAAGLPLDQVFLGSCSAGRTEDLRVAASILAGRRVAPGLKAIAIPGSRDVLLRALRDGSYEALAEAGVVLESPSCGPCGAIDKGILGPGERCAATSNRNYQGRMGSPDAELWLVSPATAAASMLTGRLSDPRGAP
jgi:3-isopropylmalate/(R)-2-methylmalate dehydratase large subunit